MTPECGRSACYGGCSFRRRRDRLGLFTVSTPYRGNCHESRGAALGHVARRSVGRPKTAAPRGTVIGDRHVASHRLRFPAFASCLGISVDAALRAWPKTCRAPGPRGAVRSDQLRGGAGDLVGCLANVLGHGNGGIGGPPDGAGLGRPRRRRRLGAALERSGAALFYCVDAGPLGSPHSAVSSIGRVSQGPRAKTLSGGRRCGRISGQPARAAAASRPRRCACPFIGGNPIERRPKDRLHLGRGQRDAAQPRPQTLAQGRLPHSGILSRHRAL